MLYLDQHKNLTITHFDSMKQPAVDYTEKDCPFSPLRKCYPILFPTCKNHNQLAGNQRIDLSVSGYSMEVFDQVADLPVDWDILLNEHCTFLSRSYLTALEQSPPKGMSFRYLLYFKQEEPVAASICQLTRFNAIENINIPRAKNWRIRLRNWFRKKIAGFLNIKLLVNGSTLLSGNQSRFFKEEVVSDDVKGTLLKEGMERLGELLLQQGEDYKGFVLKDFFEKEDAHFDDLVKYKFSRIKFQPNMILQFRPNWESFEHYLGDMSSKYRVRVRRAIKKAEKIEKRQLDLPEIENLEPIIFQLYCNVANSADFSLVELNQTYFTTLKREMPEKFQLFGYFLEEELIGFYTTIENGKEMEAHFLGFNHLNQRYQIYLNMLLDIVQLGISNINIEHINFSRTAMEIKSSIGAEAHEMFCFIRHRREGHFSNQLITGFTKFLEPKVAWKPRHPFKN